MVRAGRFDLLPAHPTLLPSAISLRRALSGPGRVIMQTMESLQRKRLKIVVLRDRVPGGQNDPPDGNGGDLQSESVQSGEREDHAGSCDGLERSLS